MVKFVLNLALLMLSNLVLLTILKFIYSEKATNFCEISTEDLPYVVTVKSKVDFSEYMNFACKEKVNNTKFKANLTL